mgnify:CR=1 FL=1
MLLWITVLKIPDIKIIFLGTVEAYPALDSLLRAADSFHPKKIVLAPFMIVAGDHAQNDLAGADPDSWMNRLSSEGYEVTPVLKGLGEYPQVRQILVEHVQQDHETFRSDRDQMIHIYPSSKKTAP